MHNLKFANFFSPKISEKYSKVEKAYICIYIAISIKIHRSDNVHKEYTDIPQCKHWSGYNIIQIRMIFSRTSFENSYVSVFDLFACQELQFFFSGQENLSGDGFGSKNGSGRISLSSHPKPIHPQLRTTTLKTNASLTTSTKEYCWSSQW